MTDETNNEEIKASTFAVVITPIFENGEWDGAVSAHMEEELLNDLDEESALKIRSVCGMMASTLELMEADPDFCEYVENYFFTKFAELAEQIVEDTPVPNFTRSEDGKVITLNMNTKTHGSA